MVSELSAGFFGRLPEMEAIQYALGEGSRLVTVHGLSGVGKSRLLAQYAESRRKGYERKDGAVYLAPLSGVRGVEVLCRRVAQSLGVRLVGRSHGEDVIRLGQALGGRGPSLVVLDDFPEGQAWARAALGHWLSLAPRASLLISGRRPTGLPGEHELELLPLPLPGVVKDRAMAQGYAALQLLMSRTRWLAAALPAAARGPNDATFGDEEMPALAELARRLEGLPLALELAAPHLARGALAPLLDSLPPRGAAKRGEASEMALERMLEKTLRRLGPTDQLALARASIFAGSFDAEAALAVLGLPPAEARPALEALVAWRLLEVDAEGRYVAHEHVRDVGLEMLVANGERAAVIERHAQHYLRRSQAADVEELLLVRSRVLECETPDRGAVSTLLEAGIALEGLLASSGPAALRLQVLSSALEHGRLSGVDTRLYAQAYEARGRVKVELGHLVQARGDLEQAQKLARELRSGRALARARVTLGDDARALGQPEEAARAYEQALSEPEASRGTRARAALGLGLILMDKGAYDRARERLEEARALAEAEGEASLLLFVHGRLGLLAWELGNLDLACAAYERVLDGALAMGARWYEAMARGGLGSIEHERGKVAEAVGHYEQAAGLLKEQGELRFEALLRGFSGAAYAELDFVEEAKASLHAAAAALVEAGDPTYVEVLALLRAPLALALARRAQAAGDPQAALDHREAALARLAAAEGDGASYVKSARTPEQAQTSQSLRIALRLVKRALERTAGPRSGSQPARS